MENSKPIVEGGAIPKPDKMKIIKVMRSKSFMNYRMTLKNKESKLILQQVLLLITNSHIANGVKNPMEKNVRFTSQVKRM